MSYSLVVLPTFSIKLKKLAKKYKKIKVDLQILQKELISNPKVGIALQHNCYKIRVPNSSTSTGESGGFRLMMQYQAY
ncbi:MAG: mRNA-degrading endonuclease RelE of RelBE toxin-antitoxin system [Sulfurimonas sp.]|jgi:mRNA-degrading endonuclease RelE of RelBE toxin-antitoxin system|uniref:hypothetical protein n=1 Tax=Sulfurimonas sp. TaxID=2022749 RepID=UPI0039E599E4